MPFHAWARSRSTSTRWFGAGRCAAMHIIIGVVSIAMVAGCTTNKWDTSDIDVTQTSLLPTFARDEAGVIASLSYKLSTVGDDLNQWAAPKDQADCAATRIVRRISTDRLLTLGYDPNAGNIGLSYTPEEATALVNILTSCIDFAEGILSVVSAYGKLSIRASACFSSGMKRLGLISDLARGVLSGQQPDPFAGTGRLSKGMGQLMAECFTEEDLPALRSQDAIPQGADEETTTTEPGSEEPGAPGSDGGTVDTTTTTPDATGG